MLMERIREYFTDTAPRPDNRRPEDRRAGRRTAVYLRATIYPIDVFSDVRICDVSATGVRGESDVELAIGQTLHITTDERIYHVGTVKWTRDRQFGLELANAADIFGGAMAEVDHGDEEGHHPRSLRTEVNFAARLVGGRPPRPAVVRNVSSTGMLLDTSPGLLSGQHLIVRVGNAAPIYGRCQWSRDGRVGFKANNPLSVFAVRNTGD